MSGKCTAFAALLMAGSVIATRAFAQRLPLDITLEVLDDVAGLNAVVLELEDVNTRDLGPEMQPEVRVEPPALEGNSPDDTVGAEPSVTDPTRAEPSVTAPARAEPSVVDPADTEPSVAGSGTDRP
jgi:hypothetical protein